MLSRNAIIIALLIVPMVADAQRGGRRRGTEAPNYDALVNEDRGEGAVLAKRDLETMNPTKLLIDKRKALSLTDSQLAQIRDLDAKLATMNDSLFKTLDSLRTEMRKKNTGLSPQVEAMRKRGIRQGMVDIVQAVRANYNATSEKAVPVLSEEQQKTANEMLDKQEKDGDAFIMEKLGGGGGRRGG